MGDRHGRAEQIAAGPDRLANGGPAMEHRLEIEVGDGRARDADVVAWPGMARVRASMKARYIVPSLLEDPLALAIEARRRCRGEDRVALELDDGEVGLEPSMTAFRRSPSTE